MRLDYQLQKLKPFIVTYLQDSQQLLNKTKPLLLPPNARLFTADVNSMYNNIDTEHAIKVIGWWLDELDATSELPIGYPLEAIKSAMTTIMRNNIFEWGVLCFLQLLGTAMGTSAAVMWATLYFGYHKAHCLIPRYSRNFMYFKHFIDDIFGIWLLDDTTTWLDFKWDLNHFGILTWEINEPSLLVDFLDLTISIKNGRVETKTFQTEVNPYLYLPPASAHPQNCTKGTIYGLICRYYANNTHREDYIHFVTLLYQRLLARGWESSFIKLLIMGACAKMETNTNTIAPQATPAIQDDLLFLHLQHHPNDISSKDLRLLYEHHCGDLFKQ
jgi:hypothetical protein